METWKHIRAILLLPFMVTLVIPGAILWLTEPDTLGLRQSVPATRVGLPLLGSALACLGLVHWVDVEIPEAAAQPAKPLGLRETLRPYFGQEENTYVAHPRPPLGRAL